MINIYLVSGQSVDPLLSGKHVVPGYPHLSVYDICYFLSILEVKIGN
jgi:hypothetical protein